MKLINNSNELASTVEKQYPNLCQGDSIIPELGKSSYVVMYDDVIFCCPIPDKWNHERTWHEALLLSEFKKCNFAQDVPLLRAFDQDRKILGMTRIKGETLAHLADDLSETEEESIGCQLGQFFTQMHAFRPSGANDLYQSLSQDVARLVTKRVEKDGRAFANSALWVKASHVLGINLQKDEIARLKEHFTEADRMDDEFVTIHNDLHPGNVIIDRETSRIGIIDFSAAEGGYRHLDFVKMGKFSATIQKACFEKYNELVLRPMDLELVKQAIQVRNLKPSMQAIRGQLQKLNI